MKRIHGATLTCGGFALVILAAAALHFRGTEKVALSDPFASLPAADGAPDLRSPGSPPAVTGPRKAESDESRSRAPTQPEGTGEGGPKDGASPGNDEGGSPSDGPPEVDLVKVRNHLTVAQEKAINMLGIEDDQLKSYVEAFYMAWGRIRTVEKLRSDVSRQGDAFHINIPACVDEWKTIAAELRANLSAILTPSQMEQWTSRLEAEQFDGFGHHARFIAIRPGPEGTWVRRRLVDEETGSEQVSDDVYLTKDAAMMFYGHLLNALK